MKWLHNKEHILHYLSKHKPKRVLQVIQLLTNCVGVKEITKLLCANSGDPRLFVFRFDRKLVQPLAGSLLHLELDIDLERGSVEKSKERGGALSYLFGLSLRVSPSIEVAENLIGCLALGSRNCNWLLKPLHKQ